MSCERSSGGGEAAARRGGDGSRCSSHAPEGSELCDMEEATEEEEECEGRDHDYLHVPTGGSMDGSKGAAAGAAADDSLGIARSRRTTGGRKRARWAALAEAASPLEGRPPRRRPPASADGFEALLMMAETAERLSLDAPGKGSGAEASPALGPPRTSAPGTVKYSGSIAHHAPATSSAGNGRPFASGGPSTSHAHFLSTPAPQPTSAYEEQPQHQSVQQLQQQQPVPAAWSYPHYQGPLGLVPGAPQPSAGPLGAVLPHTQQVQHYDLQNLNASSQQVVIQTPSVHSVLVQPISASAPPASSTPCWVSPIQQASTITTNVHSASALLALATCAPHAEEPYRPHARVIDLGSLPVLIPIQMADGSTSYALYHPQQKQQQQQGQMLQTLQQHQLNVRFEGRGQQPAQQGQAQQHVHQHQPAQLHLRAPVVQQPAVPLQLHVHAPRQTLALPIEGWQHGTSGSRVSNEVHHTGNLATIPLPPPPPPSRQTSAGGGRVQVAPATPGPFGEFAGRGSEEGGGGIEHAAPAGGPEGDSSDQHAFP